MHIHRILLLTRPNILDYYIVATERFPSMVVFPGDFHSIIYNMTSHILWCSQCLEKNINIITGKFAISTYHMLHEYLQVKKLEIKEVNYP